MKSKKSGINKQILIPIIAVILLVGIGVIGVKAIKKLTAPPEQTDDKTKKTAINEPVNIIAVSERPYFSIKPVSDGRNIVLNIHEIKKDASSMDFEMMYNSGEQIQGFGGQLSLSSLPVSEKYLLGTCSSGGKCSYHENVSGGTITTRFNGTEVYALKQDWKYIDNKNQKTDFSSKDIKFQISSDDLKNQRYLIIFNSPGYPSGLDKNPISEPYSLTTSSTLNGQADLAIKVSADSGTIMSYDGNEWTEYETIVEDGMAKATVNLANLYIVTKS